MLRSQRTNALVIFLRLFSNGIIQNPDMQITAHPLKCPLPPDCVYIQHSKNSSCVVYLTLQCVFNQGYLLVLNVMSRFIKQSHFCFPLNLNRTTGSPL